MKRFLFIVVTAALLLSACASKAEPSAAPVDQFSRDVIIEPGMGGAAPESMEEYDSGMSASQTSNGVDAAAVERLVIRNADISIVVTDVNARMQSIQTLAEKMGGFVVSSNLYQTQVYRTNEYFDVPQGSITIRVPAERLDEALSAIKQDVVEVQTETRSGQDVTADYVDLQSRLKNLEATEAQLTKILEDASNTEDVLNVFNQLTAIREQIELVKGQMKYYEESAAMSAINVTIIAEETVQPIEIAGWKPAGVARDAIQGLINFLQGFANFFIGFFLRDLWIILLVLLPFYVLFLIVRALVRKFRKPKAKAVQVEETK